MNFFSEICIIRFSCTEVLSTARGNRTVPERWIRCGRLFGLGLRVRSITEMRGVVDAE